MDGILYFGLALGVVFLLGRQALRLLKEVTAGLKKARLLNEQAKAYRDETAKMLDELMSSASGTLEPLARALSTLLKPEEDAVWKYLMDKPRPAEKAAESVRDTNSKYRQLKRNFGQLQFRAELYEQLAPWLVEHVDLPVRDLLEALLEEQRLEANVRGVGQSDREEDDPATDYVPVNERRDLTKSELFQLALDRYTDPNRKRTLWRVGIDYERYVGWAYEDQRWEVEYHGANKGKGDLGIDLVCRHRSNQRVEIVQCKRLSPIKKLPVRENVIAQTYGAAIVWCMKNEIPKPLMTPVVITSYELSEEARQFAEILGVRVEEHVELKSYPMIKCNISTDREQEKIFHLPMDQMYDKIKIDRQGECYVSTVSEAESLGFRRAYRWRGGNSNADN